MKAIVKKEKKPGIDVMDIPEPEVGPKDVLVRVEWASICGTDMGFYKWTEVAQLLLKEVPAAIGHEFAGVVEEVGGAVENISVGDRVAGETHIPCGECFNCKTGNMHICYSWHPGPGAFAEYVAWPAIGAVKLPDKVDSQTGALLEPFGVALHAIQNANIQIGDIVVVFGCGPIGIWAQQLAKLHGASAVFGVEIADYRINLAKRVAKGVEIINPKEQDVLEAVKSATDGELPDVVIEFAGSPVTINEALRIVRPGGTVVHASIPAEATTINTKDPFYRREVKLVGVSGRMMFETWIRSLRLIHSGLIDPKEVVTHVFKLEEAQKAFETVESREAGKVQFKIS